MGILVLAVRLVGDRAGLRRRAPVHPVFAIRLDLALMGAYRHCP